ncbi:ATP-dependent DNA helicase [Caerostris extrusa]|uniref:ATP-dependent DNA helicase n=1 Tax=Caerostris extrusa TaxID=172846 RepID=A0AAV4VNH1_CAEEX|nr:ATP-dependent DNA helicase [Caerostris extrusa]
MMERMDDYSVLSSQRAKEPIISRSYQLPVAERMVPIDLISKRISLPHNFLKLVTSKEELTEKEKVFPNILTNYKNHDWLNELAIVAAKNKDVYKLSNIIQSKIQSEAVKYKSVDTVAEADEAIN